MATLTQTFRPKLFRISLIKKWDNFIEMLLPRRCMLVSVGLILLKQNLGTRTTRKHTEFI